MTASSTMAPKTRSSAGSPSRKAVSKSKDYGSEGVTDNDLANLGSKDYELLGLVTAVAFFVRLFRIYQPTSVVFDEVQ